MENGNVNILSRHLIRLVKSGIKPCPLGGHFGSPHVAVRLKALQSQNQELSRIISLFLTEPLLFHFLCDIMASVSHYVETVPINTTCQPQSL